MKKYRTKRPRKVHFEMHRRDMLEMKKIKKRHKIKSVYNIDKKKCCESDASHPIVCGLIEKERIEGWRIHLKSNFVYVLENGKSSKGNLCACHCLRPHHDFAFFMLNFFDKFLNVIKIDREKIE